LPDTEESATSRDLPHWAADKLVRRLVSDLDGAPPPEVVHHYTTPSGAHGTIQSGRVWATYIHFLNDSSEWVRTADMADRVLDELGVAGCHPWAAFRQLIPELRRDGAFVVCFSGAANQLSQWRAYGGRGYSLGFNGAFLSHLASELDTTAIYAPVLYDPSAQVALMREVATAMVGKDPMAVGAAGISNQIGFYAFLSIAAVFCKDPAFGEEQEWRLAIRPDADIDMEALLVQYRATDDAIVPYIEVPLPDVGHAPLLQVLVGPSPNQRMATSGITRMLSDSRFRTAVVLESDTPFRG